MQDLEMSTYDVNKAILKKQEPLDSIALNSKVAEMAKYIASNDYTMLLNRENADYTIFHSCKNEDFSADTAKTCLWNTLHNRGRVIEVNDKEDGAYEIWLLMDDEAFVYYLFNYGQAIVEV